MPVGRTVPVAYPREKPQAARVFTWRYRVAPLFIGAFAGLAFLGAAVTIVVTG
ncbi:DUF3592 domain-containing protein [Streptomyces lunaelactis]|nr:DUF3592 domain-containing protein [Streptomyces lunaelactis]NUK05795.1 hypothetical protein [Streptomyces lunaelactis]NUK20296.1 hypothetical protein [Streptomyces lunaelactis]